VGGAGGAGALEGAGEFRQGLHALLERRVGAAKLEGQPGGAPGQLMAFISSR